MIGGWTLAAAVQPEGFDAVRRTISDLATGAVEHPWIMTTGLLLTGAAHVGTALGLRAAAPAGRWLLALGGIGAAAVALLPVDLRTVPHAVAAGTAFVALSIWPAFATPRTGSAPPPVLGRRVGVVATTVLSGLVAWFVAELVLPGAGGLTGLAERAAAGAQCLWPLVVVLALRRTRRRGRASPGSQPRASETTSLAASCTCVRCSGDTKDSA
jgi:hypothetical membrane protein